MATFKLSDVKHFIVSGKLVDGTPFSNQYSATPNGHMTAMGINLWNGKVRAFLKNGKKLTLKEVSN